MRNSVLRAAGVSLSLALLLSACSSEGSSAVDTSQLPPTAVEQPTVPPLPTTDPVLVPNEAGPTPITLAGGQGIPAPGEDTQSPDEDGDYNDAAVAEDSSSPAEDATDEPAEAATEGDAGDDTASSADADQDDDGYNGAALADDATTSTPEPTSAPRATAAPRATTAPSPTSPPAAAAPTAPPVRDAGSPQAIANGAEVFALECARCHGQRGEGVIASPMLFIGQRYTAASMVNELTNGHPFTFGFADKLSPTEISNVVAFVLSEFP